MIVSSIIHSFMPQSHSNHKHVSPFAPNITKRLCDWCSLFSEQGSPMQYETLMSNIITIIIIIIFIIKFNTNLSGLIYLRSSLLWPTPILIYLRKLWALHIEKCAAENQHWPENHKLQFLGYLLNMFYWCMIIASSSTDCVCHGCALIQYGLPK